MFLGVGTGEAMNETPATGQEFPGARSAARLAEAITLIRRSGPRSAWTSRASTTAPRRPRSTTARGARADLRGRLGPLAAKLAGRAGDGFICTSGKDPALYEELLAKVAEGAEAAGRDPAGIRRMIEVKVSYDRDRQRAFDNCRWWAALALTPEQKEGVEDPLEMERLADENADRAHPLHRLGRPGGDRRGIRRYRELGFDELVLHAPGDDQGRFLEQFARGRAAAAC